ncbi:hypothetical protein AXO25_22410 [Salmonella enterica subsp. enterica serovar Infantis]|nr:hypothetical protein [Salmonella enterica subsp. enterica serovar Infantis]
MGTVLRLCGVFIPDVFLLWFQNGEVGARASAWEVLLDSERRGLGRCKRRPLCICSQWSQR